MKQENRKARSVNEWIKADAEKESRKKASLEARQKASVRYYNRYNSKRSA
jgi:hypothetical protein